MIDILPGSIAGHRLYYEKRIWGTGYQLFFPFGFRPGVFGCVYDCRTIHFHQKTLHEQPNLHYIMLC